MGIRLCFLPMALTGDSMEVVDMKNGLNDKGIALVLLDGKHGRPFK